MVTGPRSPGEQVAELGTESRGPDSEQRRCAVIVRVTVQLPDPLGASVSPTVKREAEELEVN